MPIYKNQLSAVNSRVINDYSQIWKTNSFFQNKQKKKNEAELCYDFERRT